MKVRIKASQKIYYKKELNLNRDQIKFLMERKLNKNGVSKEELYLNFQDIAGEDYIETDEISIQIQKKKWEDVWENEEKFS